MTNNINRDATTPNKQTLLDHCIWMGTDQPERPAQTGTAKLAAIAYAAMYEGWSDLPELLTAAMNQGKSPMANSAEKERIER